MWRCLPERSPSLRNSIYASTHSSGVFMLRWIRCLISPSGERSHGISSAGMTFGRVAYSLRNSSDLTISSARQLQTLLPERACCLSSIAAICASPYVSKVLGGLVRPERRIEIGRPLHHLLQQQVHEQEQRLRLEHQVDTFLLVGVVEVLVHAAVLDQHHVAGLPRDLAAVVD